MGQALAHFVDGEEDSSEAKEVSTYFSRVDEAKKATDGKSDEAYATAKTVDEAQRRRQNSLERQRRHQIEEERECA